MKPSIHVVVAGAWVSGSLVFLAPLTHGSAKADITNIFILAVLSLTVTILLAPRLLQVSRIRQWYGWTDALSAQQVNALQSRDLRGFYHAGVASDYTKRVMPYARRLVVTGGLIELVPTVFDWAMGPVHWIMDGLLSIALYPLGVAMLILLTVPVYSRLR